jgi:hypothetical protein
MPEAKLKPRRPNGSAQSTRSSVGLFASSRGSSVGGSRRRRTQQKLSVHVNILNYGDAPARINSPRSVQAMSALGITRAELKQVAFKDWLRKVRRMCVQWLWSAVLML